ncbi:MAG TPA: hypothetical protein PKB10_01000 [Tepidisphaeraceae bacterium]|nr:hypothetical protein [Tepidisphaeraceae bacterium]
MMDLQTVIALLIVGACVFVIARTAIRAVRGTGGCGGPCGCNAKTSAPQASRPHFIPASTLRKPRRR